jgi:hypothetical protein
MLEYLIFGYMAFVAVCLVTFYWHVRCAVPVDENGYPFNAKILPFRQRPRADLQSRKVSR